MIKTLLALESFLMKNWNIDREEGWGLCVNSRKRVFSMQRMFFWNFVSYFYKEFKSGDIMKFLYPEAKQSHCYSSFLTKKIQKIKPDSKVSKEIRRLELLFMKEFNFKKGEFRKL